MIKKSKRNKRFKQVAYVTDEIPLRNNGAAQNLHLYNGGDTDPLIIQMMTAEIGMHRSVLIEKTENMDVIAATALYELRCKKNFDLQDGAIERVDTIAELVVKKHRGWQFPHNSSDEKKVWVNEIENFLFTYILMSRQEPSTKKRVELTKQWMAGRGYYPYEDRAQRVKKQVLSNLKNGLIQCTPRVSGILDISVITANQYDDDYFLQIIFWGFLRSPVVIVRSIAMRENTTHPAITIGIYDERYLRKTVLIDEIIKTIPENQNSTLIRERINVLNPSIDILTFPIMPNNSISSEVVKAVEKNYKSPA